MTEARDGIGPPMPPAAPSWVASCAPRVEGPLTRTHHRDGLLPEALRDAVCAARVPVAWSSLCQRVGEGKARALLAEGWLHDLPTMAARTAPAPAARDLTLLIASRGRPAQLAGLLLQLSHQPARVTVHVCLDGLPAEIRQSLRALQGTRVAPRVSTPRSRAAAASAIARATGLATELVAEGLAAGSPPRHGPARTGGSRNALLLGTQGRAGLFIDDDMLPVGEVHPWRPRWLAPPHAFQNTPIPPDAPMTRARHGLDLREVLAPLGMSPADLLDMSGDASFWRHADEATVRCVTAAGPPRVRLTSTGLLGDEGTSGTLHRLFLNPPLDATLREDPSAWTDLRAQRTAARSAGSGALGPGHPWMSALAGVDPSDGWAPFLHLGRGSDTTFARTLHHLHDDAVGASLPLMALHQPAGRTPHPDGPLADLCTMHLNAVVHAALDALQPSAQDPPATRLHRLGHAIFTRIGPSPASLRDAWMGLQRHRDATLLVSLHALAARGPRAGAWRQDVLRATQALETELASPTPRPAAGFVEPDPWSEMHRTLCAWASLCLAWPAVQQHAHHLDAALLTPEAALDAGV